MTDYLQPEFYRFNEDSLKLVNWITAEAPVAATLLDLGAGSGVIGIELANRLKVAQLTLLEVQNKFIPFLQQNVREQLKTNSSVCIVNSSFGNWVPDKNYDLIVCNPPYYLAGHGEASKDSGRNIARSFIIDDWKVLLGIIHNALSKSGRAYLVIKKDQKILNLIEQAATQLSLKLHEEGQLYFLELARLDIN
jgi:tRNA1(Val) A37 N6-methylase TrmN6